MVLIAMTMTLLVLFVGLGVDTGNLMGKRAKLQSAVDTAALSAAETLVGSNVLTSTAVTKAYQILEANGIPSATLSLRQVDFPATGQVRVQATQRVDTFFMKLIPAFRQMDVSADATADINSYAEINFKPYGQPGVVNELNISVWGTDSWRSGGDGYSPIYNGNSALNTQRPNPWYGYLYRIDVPPSYSYNYVNVQIFDPDTYNRPGSPPAWPTPYVCPGPQCGSPTPTPSPDQYASCTNPAAGACSSNGAQVDTAMHLTAFQSGRAAFWRADEFRNDHTAAGIQPSTYSDSLATTSQYTLWHFDPHITSAFGDPTTLTDQPPNACGGCLATYSVGSLGSSTLTDLSWYQPSGFNIKVRDGSDPSCNFGGGSCFARESNGGVYFYLYVLGTAGSSENNFDLRVGPAHSELSTNLDCSSMGASPYSTNCYVNRAYALALPDWQTGGVNIFAKRAMPLNLDTGDHFPMLFTQVSKYAAGQTLGIRHFDQDDTGGAGSHMQYQMQKCVLSGGSYTPCQPTSSDSCFSNVADGYVGPNNGWNNSGYPDPEPVQIPLEGSSGYTDFFGPNGECPTSWLRLQSDPSFTQDTTVWEMPFVKPRLVK